MCEGNILTLRLFTSIFFNIHKISALCISVFSESCLSQKCNLAFMTASVGLTYLSQIGFKSKKSRILLCDVLEPGLLAGIETIIWL